MNSKPNKGNEDTLEALITIKVYGNRPPVATLRPKEGGVISPKHAELARRALRTGLRKYMAEQRRKYDERA